MPAITHQKYDTKMAIFELLDRYLELRPDKAIEIAKGLARSLASAMTLRELKGWHQRIQDGVKRAEDANRSQKGIE